MPDSQALPCVDCCFDVPRCHHCRHVLNTSIDTSYRSVLNFEYWTIHRKVKDGPGFYASRQLTVQILTPSRDRWLKILKLLEVSEDSLSVREIFFPI